MDGPCWGYDTNKNSKLNPRSNRFHAKWPSHVNISSELRRRCLELITRYARELHPISYSNLTWPSQIPLYRLACIPEASLGQNTTATCWSVSCIASAVDVRQNYPCSGVVRLAFGGSETVKCNAGPFWIGGGLGILSALVALLLVKPLMHDGMKAEDNAFHQCPGEHELDASIMHPAEEGYLSLRDLTLSPIAQPTTAHFSNT